jgi:hypothetical protein
MVHTMGDGNAQIVVIPPLHAERVIFDPSWTVVAGQKEQRTLREHRRNQAEARHSILRHCSQASDQTTTSRK